MSENLVGGQGTYHYTDMLPDSGDEANSLWARYLAENAEWAKHRSMYMIMDHQGGTIYYESYGGKNYNHHNVYLLPDVGTYYISAKILRTAGGTSQWTLAIEPFGTFGTFQEVTAGLGGPQGTIFEFTLTSSLGSGWGTLWTECPEGTLYWARIWGRM